MANYFPLLILFSTLISTTSPQSSPPPPLQQQQSQFPTQLPLPPPTRLPPPPSQPPQQPPQSPPPSQQQQQLNNVVDALIGSGDFGNWANILSFLDPSILPFSATLFIPNDDAFSQLSTTTFDPSLFPYHIVPQRLSFSDLTLFQTNSRLPTLFPERTILITNNSLSNFTLDDSKITYPDLYMSDAVSVHGINKILDYEVYGYPLKPEVARPPPPRLPLRPSPLSPPPPFHPFVVGEVKGEGSCLESKHFAVGLSVLCALFVIKIDGFLN